MMADILNDCVTVQSRCPHRKGEALALARRLSIQCVPDDRVPAGQLRLVLLEEGMQVWDEHSRRHGLNIDFRAIDRRVGSGSLSRKQPLARAIGKSTQTVVDATAGLGHDAFLLACLGFQVTAIERHPLIGVLLETSVQAARSDPELLAVMDDRLEVVLGDARDYLADAAQARPDVIYLDPMFQPRRRSALPRKPAQLLRQVVGHDEDAQLLFALARRCARRRVVVKRADDLPPLAPDVDLTFAGKIVRYDVYQSVVSHE
jgi:16S rRNA (guanine1516-N2)-methyltransferase